ncbi:MAG: four helix bundle protein [Candidatus Paceibacterota bacterium]|jgi:four helix bundle protein
MSGNINNFYDLKVWKDAHKIILEIYKETKDFPDSEKFGLISQMRRSASSITANIAEGFGRYHFKDKIKFYQQARGSAVELQDQIFLSKDLNFIAENKAKELFGDVLVVLKEINGIIKKTKERISL